MKILFATEVYLPTIGGSAKALHRLAKELVKQGHNVSIIAPSKSWIKSSREIIDGINIYRVPSVTIEKTRKVRISPNFLHLNRVGKIIKNVMPDLIHVTSPDFIAQSAFYDARHLGIPILATSHVMEENMIGGIYLPKNVSKAVASLYMKQVVNFYNKLDFIIAPTPAAEKLLVKQGLKTPSRSISNGINLNEFSPGRENSSYFRKKWGAENVPILLYVGRLDKEKRLDILLKSAAILKKTANFKLVIVGKGVQLKHLKKLTQKLKIDDICIFAGFISDKNLPLIYRESDIFVTPSTAELQSLATMEAMATGLPVVGANAVALPHLIRDGRNGFLFIPDNEKDLANKLLSLINDTKLREKMGKESLKLIAEHDIGKVVKELMQVYEQILLLPKTIKSNKLFTPAKRALRLSKKLLAYSASE